MNGLRKAPKVTDVTELIAAVGKAEAAQDIPKVRGLLNIGGRVRGKLAVFLDPEVFIALRTYSAKTGKPMSDIAADLIKGWLANLPEDK